MKNLASDCEGSHRNMTNLRVVLRGVSFGAGPAPKKMAENGAFSRTKSAIFPCLEPGFLNTIL
jgi:hypothetical protein